MADNRFRGWPQTKGCPGRTGRPQEFRKNLLRIRQGVGGNLAASATRYRLRNNLFRWIPKTGEEIMTSIDVPETVRVWKIGVDQANVRSWNNYTNNGGYNLFNMTNGRHLTWEEVKHLELIWDTNLKEITRRILDFPMGKKEKYSQVSLSRSGLAAVQRFSITQNGM